MHKKIVAEVMALHSGGGVRQAWGEVEMNKGTEHLWGGKVTDLNAAGTASSFTINHGSYSSRLVLTCLKQTSTEHKLHALRWR